MSDGWIVVPHWKRHQHYRDRTPPWIKVYTSLLHNPEYRDLTAHQRAVLHGLWLVYASSGGQVRASTSSLSRQLNLRVSSVQLEALNHAGFIRFRASKPLSVHARARARSREAEAETEKKDLVAKPKNRNNAKRDAPELLTYHEFLETLH